MTEYHRAVAGFLKLLMITLEANPSDRSDITRAAYKLRRMPNQNEALTPLARDTADKAMLWAYFDQADDAQTLYNSAYALLRALEHETLGTA